MWFSDRPRPQQRLAVDLGQLYLIVPEQNYSNFSLAFWTVMAREWIGIDHHRLDKFLLLVRRVLFYQLKRLRESDWDERLVNGFLHSLKQSPLSGDKKVPTGIPYHLIDIYADELERLMFEEIDEDDEKDEEEEKQKIIADTPLSMLIEPFVTLGKDALLKTLREKIRDDILLNDKLMSWNAIEEDEKENDEDEEDNDEDEDEAEEDSEDEWKGFE